jgi:hypothetical protein
VYFYLRSAEARRGDVTSLGSHTERALTITPLFFWVSSCFHFSSNELCTLCPTLDLIVYICVGPAGTNMIGCPPPECARRQARSRSGREALWLAGAAINPARQGRGGPPRRLVGGGRGLHEWGARLAGCSRRSLARKLKSRRGVAGRTRGGGEGKERGGRGGTAPGRRAESGEAAVVSQSRPLSSRRFGAAVRCAASSGHWGAPGAREGARGVGTGEPALREESGRNRRAEGPRAWRWGAEAPKGAPPRWATWRVPREDRASRPQSPCCCHPARCRCPSLVNWRRGSPWFWWELSPAPSLSHGPPGPDAPGGTLCRASFRPPLQPGPEQTPACGAFPGIPERPLAARDSPVGNLGDNAWTAGHLGGRWGGKSPAPVHPRTQTSPRLTSRFPVGLPGPRILFLRLSPMGRIQKRAP